MGLLDFLSLRRKAPDVLPAYTAIMAQRVVPIIMAQPSAG
jgi:hypothetical protein